MNVVVVVPTYNEHQNIQPLVTRITELGLQQLTLLFVDDASPDGTGDVIERLRLQHPWIHVLHRKRKTGIGTAYRDGFLAAHEHHPDAIVQMDADGSHDPSEIPRMLAHITAGADLVVGSRNVHGGKIVGWSLYRHCTSRGAQWISRRLLGLRTHDVTSGYRAWRADTLAAILQHDAQYGT